MANAWNEWNSTTISSSTSIGSVGSILFDSLSLGSLPSEKTAATAAYTARQNAWVKENKIGPRTIVRVLRKAKAFEEGWGCEWVSPMDVSVGKFLHIKRDEGCDGLRLSDGFLYPFFVLGVDKEGAWELFKQDYPQFADVTLSVPQQDVLLNLLLSQGHDFSLHEIRQLIKVISMGGSDVC